MKFKLKSAPMCFLFLVAGGNAKADLNHYRNVLLGDRAAGLGGAYTAIADDASAIIYNPAGMAFSSSSNMSGSANAYMSKELEYKEVVGSKSFFERSGGLFPTFLGGIQRLDNISNGLVAGFAVYSPDSENQKQDDQFSDAHTNLQGYHRSAIKNSQILHVSGGIAKRITPWISGGLALSYVKFDELSQVFQDTEYNLSANSKIKLVDPSKGPVSSFSSENRRIATNLQAIEPSIGIQMSFLENFSFGLVAKKPIIISQGLEYKADSTAAFRFKDYTLVQDSDLDPSMDEATKANVGSGKVNRSSGFLSTDGTTENAQVEEPFEEWPLEVRAGLAWFATTKLLLSADITYHSGSGSPLPVLNRMPVINYSMGSEYYITPALPLRVGAFTNFDASEEINPSLTNQNDHINYYGTTLALGWSQETSQVTLTGVYQKGNGKAQKLSNTTALQDVDATSLALIFSASHTLD